MTAKSFGEVSMTAISQRSPNGATYPVYQDVYKLQVREVKYLSSEKKKNRKRFPK